MFIFFDYARAAICCDQMSSLSYINTVYLILFALPMVLPSLIEDSNSEKVERYQFNEAYLKKN
jgi:hypothetical protein